MLLLFYNVLLLLQFLMKTLVTPSNDPRPQLFVLYIIEYMLSLQLSLVFCQAGTRLSLVFILLIHCRVTLSIKLTGTHLYLGGVRHCESRDLTSAGSRTQHNVLLSQDTVYMFAHVPSSSCNFLSVI